jgi:hypothetical protein
VVEIMCTLLVLRRPGHEWPLLVAGNRDELRERPWAPPARHWGDRPDVVAGLDRTGGGSWLGMNDNGVVAAVMNREGSLGPAPGKRSRGELVLEALDHAEAREAAEALAALNPAAYRPFNLFVGDPLSAFWVRHRGDSAALGVEVLKVSPGLHMLTARELDDVAVPRIRVYLPRFRDARPPEPGRGEWSGWQGLLASRIYPESEGLQAAMNIDPGSGFGTLCSHLVAVPRYPGFEPRPVFLFAAGAPDGVLFEAVITG